MTTIQKGINAQNTVSFVKYYYNLYNVYSDIVLYIPDSVDFCRLREI